MISLVMRWVLLWFFFLTSALFSQSLDELIANQEFEQAKEQLEQLVVVRRSALQQDPSELNSRKLGEALLSTGMVFDRCGQSKEGVVYLLEAKTFLPEKRWQGDLADALGKAFQHQGDYQSAEKFFKEAIELRVEEREWQLVSRDHLGLLKILQGQLHEAGRLFQENLAETPLEATAQRMVRLTNLARYYSVAHRWNEAEKTLKMALANASSLSVLETAPISAELAEVYLSTGRSSDAANLLEETTARLDSSKRGELLLIAELSGSAALAYLETGEVQKSQQILEELIPFIEAEINPDFLSLSSLRLILSECYLRQNRAGKAQSLFPKILSQLNRSVSDVSLPNLHARRLQARAFSSDQASMGSHLSTLTLHSELTQQMALQGSDLQRLEFFRDAAYPLIIEEDSPEAIAQYAIESKGLITELLFRERSQDPERLQRIAQLEMALNFDPNNLAFQEELRELVSQRKAYDLEKFSFEKIVENLDKGEALIDFLIYLAPNSSDPQIGALVYRPKEAPIWLPSLISKRALESYLSLIHREFQRELEIQESQAKGSSRVKIDVLIRRLSELLWHPVSQYLPDEVERLFLCPDGVVNNVPSSILVEEDDALLLHRCEAIVHLVRARDLVRKPASLRSELWACLGVTEQNSPQGEQRDSPYSPKFVSHLKSLKSLRGAQDELQVLRDFFSYREAHAREEHLSTFHESPRVLHVVSHGYSNHDSNRSVRENLFRSCLIFSKPNLNASQASNDLFFAEEIALLDFSETDLVTLSACSTAQGFQVHGESLIGLRRAFEVAGARNQLVSLWPISDRTTPRFMKDFYSSYRSSNDASKALTQALQQHLPKKLMSDRIQTDIRLFANYAPFIVYSQTGWVSSD